MSKLCKRVNKPGSLENVCVFGTPALTKQKKSTTFFIVECCSPLSAFANNTTVRYKSFGTKRKFAPELLRIFLLPHGGIYVCCLLPVQALIRIEIRCVELSKKPQPPRKQSNGLDENKIMKMFEKFSRVVYNNYFVLCNPKSTRRVEIVIGGSQFFDVFTYVQGV